MAVAALAARFDQAEPVPEWQAPDMSVLAAGRMAPPVMPSAMFGDLWPVVRDLAEGAGSPVDYVAISIVAVAASLIGAKRRVQPFATSPQWQEPCILWVAPVGDPSSNKSPAIDAATGILRVLEQEGAADHKLALGQHEVVLERAKVERARWQESVKQAAKDGFSTPPMPSAAILPDEPQRRRMLVQDATPEALGEILSGNPNGTLHLRDELAGWLMSFERYSPGGREFWLEAYGGRAHVIDRKSLKEPLAIPFNGVTVLGGIQPDKLADCLLNVTDDGLVARFLWAWPDPVPYHRPRNIADADRLARAYRRLDELRPARDENGAEKPIVVMLDDGAAEIFEKWVAETGESVRDAASLYKGFVGKLRGTALRLALVVELLAWADGVERDEPVTIRAESIVAAIGFLEDYARPTALRVFGAAALPASERNAALLARYIVKTGAREINARDIRRTANIPTLKAVAEVDQAIEALTEAGWLRHVPSDGRGRPRRDFTVNPAVHAVARNG
jgi:hypothetical protein